MMKAFLILVLLIGAWMLLTEQGQAFYEKHVSSESGPKDPRGAERLALAGSLEAQIREKEAKIDVLTREMQREMGIRAARVSTPLRTDPIFLERSIKRLEEEKRELEARLVHVQMK